MKYIAESVSFTAVCFVLAFLLAYALLPMMNDLLRGVSGGTAGSLEQFVSIRFEWSVGIVAAYVLTVVVLGVLSGIAPAAIASRFEPIDVVRGTYRLQTKRVFSKVFIVFQNTITIVLIHHRLDCHGDFDGGADAAHDEPSHQHAFRGLVFAAMLGKRLF